MGHSIQEISKKINSTLSVFDVVSLVLTAVILTATVFFLSYNEKANRPPVVYRESNIAVPSTLAETKPFGSKNGTTYTFSWCRGGSTTKPENKVYFKDVESAEKAGRTLSKLCN